MEVMKSEREIPSLAEENAAWGMSFNARDGDGKKSYRFCQKHESLSLYDVVIFRL